MAKDLNKIENNAYKVLIEPWITEATTLATELNKYVFKVEKKSSKLQIRKAIEGLYKVKVLNVRTITIPSKIRIRGRVKGVKAGFKKAIITLKKGDSIDLFKTK